MGWLRWVNRLSQRLIRRHWPMAARAWYAGQHMLETTWDQHWNRTCSFDKCFGRLSTSIRRRPTPMAPDETMMTLWPSSLNLTAVSTIDVRMERRGSWVFSSTMELVPGES